jgi:cerevisin
MVNFSLSVSSVALLVASALDMPTALYPIETFDGETTGKHIVTLKLGVNKDDLLKTLEAKVTVTHEWDVIKGFAAEFDDGTLEELRANPDIKNIAEDGLMDTNDYSAGRQSSFPTLIHKRSRTNAPWGISRLSSTTRFSSQDTRCVWLLSRHC